MVTLGRRGRNGIALPEVTAGERHGTGRGPSPARPFAWERPFSKADIKRYGDETPPAGPILAISVADLGEKEAIIAANPRAFFTISHFDGYAAVLVDLTNSTKGAIRDALLDGWLACAPREAGVRALPERHVIAHQRP